MVVMKRLADAVRDGNTILGVVEGSACTHAGRTIGIAVPSAPAQARVMREALRQAGRAPSESAVGQKGPLKVLLLQGPVGPFFRQLHKRLVARGDIVKRITFTEDSRNRRFSAKSSSRTSP